MRTKLVIILSISLITIIGIFSLIEKNSYYSSIYYDKVSNSMFKSYANHENNYQLFIPNNSNDIEIYFPENISQYDFTNLKLYYDDKIIEADYEIIDIKEKSVQLRINEYFEKFNKISVEYKNKDIFLYTGNYYFEYLEDIGSIKESPVFLVEKHSVVQGLSYKMTLKLNTLLADDVLKVIIPKRVLDDNILKSNNLTFDNNNNMYIHIIELEQNELENKQLSRISLDVILVLDSFEQPSSDNIILKTNIPFQLY